MIRELTIEKIRNSPTLSDEKWVSINLPDVYSKILNLTKHMNRDSLYIRINFIQGLQFIAKPRVYCF